MTDWQPGYQESAWVHSTGVAEWLTDESGVGVAPINFRQDNPGRPVQLATANDPPSEGDNLAALRTSAGVDSISTIGTFGTGARAFAQRNNQAGSYLQWNTGSLVMTVNQTVHDPMTYFPESRWPAGAVGVELETDSLIFADGAASFTGTVQDPGHTTSFGLYQAPANLDMIHYPSTLAGYTWTPPGAEVPVTAGDFAKMFTGTVDAPRFHMAVVFVVNVTPPAIASTAGVGITEQWAYQDIDFKVLLNFTTPRFRWVFPAGLPPLRRTQRGDGWGVGGVPRAVQNSSRQASLRRGAAFT